MGYSVRVTATGVVRRYFSKFRFGTARSCAKSTGLTEDQVKSAIQTLRDSKEIEYRGMRGSGFYMQNGYNNGLTEYKKRERRTGLVDANTKYMARIESYKLNIDAQEDSTDGETEGAYPEGHEGKDEWDVLRDAILRELTES